MVSTRQSSNMGSSSGSGSVEVGEVSTLKKHQPVTTADTSNNVSIESCNLNLLDLPVEVLEKIFSYLGFNTVAHMRLVSGEHLSKLVHKRCIVLDFFLN